MNTKVLQRYEQSEEETICKNLKLERHRPAAVMIARGSRESPAIFCLCGESEPQRGGSSQGSRIQFVEKAWLKLLVGTVIPADCCSRQVVVEGYLYAISMVFLIYHNDSRLYANAMLDTNRHEQLHQIVKQSHHKPSSISVSAS